MSRLYETIVAITDNPQSKIQLIEKLQNEINKDEYLITDNNMEYWYNIGGNCINMD